MKNYSLTTVLFFGALLTISACAKLQPQVVAEPASGTEKMIDMQATSYHFTPNNIKTSQGDTIVFRITNVSDTVHNFTIEDPHGKKIQDVDLPKHATMPVKVTFTETGNYEFYCDKPLHSTFGMKGQVQVEPASP